MAVLGPVQTTTALALPAVTTVPCHNIIPHAGSRGFGIQKFQFETCLGLVEHGFAMDRCLKSKELLLRALHCTIL